MSAQKVAQELNRLSYSDMQLLAAKLLDRIREHEQAYMVTGLEKTMLADSLAALNEHFVNTEDPVDADATRHLKKAFSSRARSIHVTVRKDGFQVHFGKYQGVGQRLPDAINDLLDQIVVMKAMGVG